MNDLRHIQDVGLEAVVLGTILRDGDRAFNEVSPLLSVEDFVTDRHRQILVSIQRVAPEVSLGIDSVAHDLLERNKLESIGGFPALIDVDAQGLPGVKMVGFAQQLRAKSDRRRIIGLVAKLSEIVEAGDDGQIPDVLEEIKALSEGTRGAGSASVFRIDDLPPVGASQEPIAYLRDPELPESSLIGITGDSGSGKSTLVRAWVRDAIACGSPCLILDRESPRPVAADCMDRLGLADSPLLRWWGGWNGDAPAPTTAIVIEWVKACLAAGLKPIVVIDSLIAFLGGDENDSNVMRSFMNGARHLADLGATVIVIHHDGKADSARDFRGSSDWKASVDAAFHVTNIASDGKLDRLNLRCYKSRYGFSGSIVYRYAGGRFVRDEREDAPAIVAADQLTALLRTNPGIGAKEFVNLAVKANLGRNRARDFLADGFLAGTVRRDPGTKNRQHYYLVLEAK